MPTTSNRTRTGYAWIAICAAVTVAVALVVFIAQNAQPVRVSFLVWHGRFPLAVALLAAATTTGIVAAAIGSARIVQLRRTASRGARQDVAPAEAPGKPTAEPSLIAAFGGGEFGGGELAGDEFGGHEFGGGAARSETVAGFSRLPA